MDHVYSLLAPKCCTLYFTSTRCHLRKSWGSWIGILFLVRLFTTQAPSPLPFRSVREDLLPLTRSTYSHSQTSGGWSYVWPFLRDGQGSLPPRQELHLTPQSAWPQYLVHTHLPPFLVIQARLFGTIIGVHGQIFKLSFILWAG